jgi:hypothetical protein
MTVGRSDSLPRAERGGRTVGKVETILESWRIDDEWWRETISRTYMALLLEGGKRIVIFQNLRTGLWYMQQP